MFPRDRVMASPAKYAIARTNGESTEALRERLAAFYARRTLTEAAVTIEDQAVKAYLPLSRAFSKTT
ncbi:MAG: hypothetical protein NVSMB42_19440 [Herpetosiphon sp.]